MFHISYRVQDFRKNVRCLKNLLISLIVIPSLTVPDLFRRWIRSRNMNNFISGLHFSHGPKFVDFTIIVCRERLPKLIYKVLKCVKCTIVPANWTFHLFMFCYHCMVLSKFLFLFVRIFHLVCIKSYLSLGVQKSSWSSHLRRVSHFFLSVSYPYFCKLWSILHPLKSWDESAFF